MVYKYNRGIALFISVALLFLLSVGVIIVLLTAYNYTNINENLTRRMRAIAFAEAGINYAYWELKKDPDYSGDTFNAGSGILQELPSGSGWSIVISVENYPPTGRKRIRSTVNYPKAAVF